MGGFRMQSLINTLAAAIAAPRSAVEVEAIEVPADPAGDRARRSLAW
jgi:hypothetical protein